MASPLLRVRLLGDIDLRFDGGAPLPLRSMRAASLLSYLLLSRDAPQSRQHIAFLLWPESTESQARTNLRHALHDLRRALPDADQFLDVTTRSLQWRPDADCWLDVTEFEVAIAAENDIDVLRRGIDLYRGELLTGHFDEWLLGERERLQQRYLDALERAASLLEEMGDHHQALLYAERLFRGDPLREEAYRIVMRLHDARGDRARALRAYHLCEATLERELGVQPSARTREIYESLMPIERENEPDLVAGPPLVGRIPERKRLMATWRASERGRAQLVILTGEPGVGKTRLVEEFRSWCVHRGATGADARSYAAEGALAYGPVIAWLRSEALARGLNQIDRIHLTEAARVLPELFLARPDLPRPEPLPENEQRYRLFDAMARAILASESPLLLVADDIHWADRETLHFLHYLLRVAPDAPLLIAATARREELDDRHPLHGLISGAQALDRYLEIAVGRLTRAETLSLAQQLAGQPIEDRDADLLFNDTEGNPLFVVESVRAGWSGGHLDRNWLSPKVQTVIQSRLAQLSEPARSVAQIAATIGREFTADVLAHASGAGEESLVRSLDELWRRRIIRDHGPAAYDFSHDKIREVAYLTLSPILRQHYHLRVARALEHLYALDQNPPGGQLASHFERAGQIDEAIDWYERAAEASRSVYANVDGVHLLERALDLLRAMPVSPERQARELAILSALPGLLLSVDGYQSRRLEDVHERAIEIAGALNTELTPQLLRSIALASLSRGNLETARHFGKRLHDRGERSNDDVLRSQSDYVLGIAAFWGGELDTAQVHFENAIQRYRPEDHHIHLLDYGHDIRMICQMRLGYTLWLLGRADDAIGARDSALAMARDGGHPYARSVNLVFSTLLALDMRELDAFHAYRIELARQGEPTVAAHVQIMIDAFQGYVEILDGRHGAGITAIRSVMERSQMTEQAPGAQAMLARVLLEGCLTAGDARAGLEAATQTLERQDGVILWIAETYRLRAEFRAMLGASDEEIEADLSQAMSIARRQGSRALELRAAMSLIRHRQRRVNRDGADAARDRLAKILAGFSNRRSTPDIAEASMLLANH